MASDGHTYDRAFLQSWIQTCTQQGQVPRSPVTSSIRTETEPPVRQATATLLLPHPPRGCSVDAQQKRDRAAHFRVGRVDRYEVAISSHGSDPGGGMIEQVGGIELVPGEMRPNHNLRKLIGNSPSLFPSSPLSLSSSPNRPETFPHGCWARHQYVM